MHDPVLLSESISFLLTDPGGIYVDCTLGGGGHLNCLMEELNNEARVIAIDKDETVMNQTRSRFINKPNITFVYDDFKNLSHILSQNNVAAVDGILIDLGVSSFQLDESSRGFSYHNEATLDMRMDLNQELDAKYIVNHYSEQQLSQLIFTYGEERFARTIARNIAAYRAIKEIETTLELAEIIKSSIPARYKRDKHPARKTFQALRIVVNGEMDSLNQVLPQTIEGLKSGGRLCIITFHSLEDRIVKQFYQQRALECICPPGMPVCTCNHQAELKIITRKPVIPKDEEINNNPRARSAKLRVAERR
ncbi:MAG TPA: 16S rRNA (cytosine(1402)-N(4))-methyltransferase RsmH [Syntrophomonadaceae bacterium]|nr:16S rRNA (cytosine(1402)-N(4))-methyltransferase RsmH [Syntrophomonadaceae bacterium]HRX20287.1 16S rRNA (cytosine(1402)-N(4))-methyltransferase RsmH [Syntrophomonadaceae bacterium]